MHQRWSGLGWLQSWPVGVGTSIPSSVFPREALELPHEGGKDLTAGMENKPAFFIGKQSGTCTSRQDIDHDLASTASIMVHSLSCWTIHPKATVDVIFLRWGFQFLTDELKGPAMWALPGKRSLNKFSWLGQKFL